LHQRVLTDEWLYDPKTAEHISAFLQEIKQAIVDHNATIYPESDLFLELGQAKDSDLQCGYYFVHHPTKTIYWLEEVSLECQSLNFSGLVRGEITNDQASGSEFKCCDILCSLTVCQKFVWRLSTGSLLCRRIEVQLGLMVA
jgi:hypothetical protein